MKHIFIKQEIDQKKGEVLYKCAECALGRIVKDTSPHTAPKAIVEEVKHI